MKNYIVTPEGKKLEVSAAIDYIYSELIRITSELDIEKLWNKSGSELRVQEDINGDLAGINLLNGASQSMYIKNIKDIDDPTSVKTQQYIDDLVSGEVATLEATLATKADLNNTSQSITAGSLQANDIDIINTDGKNVIQYKEDLHPGELWLGEYSASGEAYAVDVIVRGNMYVSGTTTQVHTEETYVRDNKIILNADYGGATPVEDAHIFVDRGSGATMADFTWNETDDQWEVGVSGNTHRVVTEQDYPALSITRYGAIADDSTDCTTAIQNAINDARDDGGGVVFIPVGTFKITNTLTLYTGVRLIGYADSFQGTGGGVGPGSVIHMTGDAPAIVIDGASGYGIEIGHFHLKGETTNSSSDGIVFTTSNPDLTVRTTFIHDLSIRQFGRDSISLHGGSYIKLYRITATEYVRNGLYVHDESAISPLQEFLSLRDCVFGTDEGSDGTPSYGIKLVYGSYISMTNVNCTGNTINMHILEGVRHVGSRDLVCDGAGMYEIEIYAPTSYVSQIRFYNTRTYRRGLRSLEKGLYIHTDGSMTSGISDSLFDGFYDAQAGSEWPDYPIYLERFIHSKIIGVAYDRDGKIYANVGNDVCPATIEFTNANYPFEYTIPTGWDQFIVTGRNHYWLYASAGTTIQNFIFGSQGQRLFIKFMDDNITIDFSSGTYLIGNNGVDWHPQAGDYMECVLVWLPNAWKWVCVTSSSTDIYDQLQALSEYVYSASISGSIEDLISSVNEISGTLEFVSGQNEWASGLLLEHIADIDNPHEVTKDQVGLGNVFNILDNPSGTTDPTVNDDENLGYSVLSRWANTVSDTMFVCLDPISGAAVWIEGGGGTGGTISGSTSGVTYYSAIQEYDLNYTTSGDALRVYHNLGTTKYFPYIVDSNGEYILPDVVQASGYCDIILDGPVSGSLQIIGGAISDPGVSKAIPFQYTIPESGMTVLHDLGTANPFVYARDQYGQLHLPYVSGMTSSGCVVYFHSTIEGVLNFIGSKSLYAINPEPTGYGLETGIVLTSSGGVNWIVAVNDEGNLITRSQS